MSHVSVPQLPEFNFWEFVSCAVCNQFFTPENGGPPPVPFWLTECGHVICNTHLNPNQSCAQCGSTEIQLAPLQHDMDPLLANMFQSVPHGFEGVATAARFQQESLARLVRHYRRKSAQQSILIDRCRARMAGDKAEIQRLRNQLGLEVSSRRPYSTYEEVNTNGKRPRTQTSSSPHSLTAPDRLTLPPTHQQPHFPGPNTSATHRPRPPTTHPPNTQSHIVSDSNGRRRFSAHDLQQFAYAPPDPVQEHYAPIPTLPQAQTAPTPQHSGAPMTPAPAAQASQPAFKSKFRPALGTGASSRTAHMPPPPTPQPRLGGGAGAQRTAFPPQQQQPHVMRAGRSFLPPPTPIRGPTVPVTPTCHAPPSAMPSGPPRATNRFGSRGNSGQRQPFVPGGGVG